MALSKNGRSSPESEAVGLGLALLLMGFVNFVSYRNATQLTQSAQKLEHTHQVLNNLINVFATLTDAESGRRGYILFGNQSELERYHRTIQSIEPKLTFRGRMALVQRGRTNPPAQKHAHQPFPTPYSLLPTPYSPC